MKVIKAPESIDNAATPLVFFAGSIEMGKAEDWQTKLTKRLECCGGTILNPRRDDWDSSWVQSIHNEKFNEQVVWELDGLDAADLIAVYFDPNTNSPITLLELGAYRSDNIIVCCPEKFYRRGNVEIFCKRHNIPLHDTFDTFAQAVEEEIDALY